MLKPSGKLCIYILHVGIVRETGCASLASLVLVIATVIRLVKDTRKSNQYRLGFDCNISLSSPNFDKRWLSNKDVG